MARLDRATRSGTVLSRPSVVAIPIVAATLEMTGHHGIGPDRVARSSRAMTVTGRCLGVRAGIFTSVGPRPKPGLLNSRQASTAVEFAVCAMAMVLIIVGCTEFGRLVWTFEVLQEAASEGARCMGLRASGCASAGAYSSVNTTNYIVSVATSRGVVITAPMLTLSNTASCGGAAGFSEVTISYDFKTVAPALLTSIAGGFTIPASSCFPNNS
jgi:hypothetical protein